MVRIAGEQFGDYRLLRPLGEGGFAEVYEAEHVHLPGMKAAIKLLKGRFTPKQIEELRREALLVGKLDHPHIVRLLTFSIERDIPYLAMAYAQGGTLSQRYPRGTRVALAEMLAYVRPVAQALQYAHEQRVIHRDLKPANLLLTQDGRVQVADFGIAVAAHNSQSRTMQEIAGTWVYMAPEQFRGQAEAASDQYSLAIMVYQWLSGHVPFDGNENMYLIPQQQQEQTPPSLRAQLPELLPAIEYVVMKALAKDPRERFASVQEFAEALVEASKPPFVPAPGQRLGDYRLLRKLGEGGFAEVYEAEHLHLGTKAAIKLLKGTFTPAQVEGLRQEARTVIQLEHQHIIRAHGFSIEGKIPYLIMAYAPGGSLATRHEQGTPLPLETIREYVRQIAAALQYAHNQRITHRDIKPENILLAQDGRLQVADFGIAIMAQTTQAAQEAQEIVGSWTYMAPEQFTGQAEPASDQYALAIMVYQWLCGEPPFTGNGSIYALPYQHMSEPPPPLRDRLPTLSPRVEQVIMKALAKKPAERFVSLPAFAHALEEACTTPPIGTTLLTYEHLGGKVNAIAWSPDGTRIASGGDDATVQIWDAATGQKLLTIRGHTASVNAVAWSPNGRLLASASGNTTQVWEAISGKLIRRYNGHTSFVNAVAWSPDGHLLASASGGSERSRRSRLSDYSVQVWEVGSGKLLLRYDGHTDSVRAVAWSPDGHLLASASWDNTVQVWEATSGKLLLRYDGHTSYMSAIVWSPDGHLLASASFDNTVQVWAAASGKLFRRYDGHTSFVNAVAWSPDGRLLASASSDKSVQVWEAISGKPVRRYESLTDSMNAVAWSPDGRLLASASGGIWASSGHSVQIWEAGSGKLLCRYDGHTASVLTVAWSPDGRRLASASPDKSVQVWEATSGKLLLRYDGHTSIVFAVAWSPDGRLLASASGDKSVQVWEATSGKLLLLYNGHTSNVRAVAWSPDGRLLASASSGTSVQVWEATSGKLVQRYEAMGTVAWSPDGRLLASASGDNSVQVWEATSGKLLLRYNGHTHYVQEVAWSPDGRLLASASNDNSVQVWEATSGKLLRRYDGHTSDVRAVAWSPDGRLLASASNDNSVRIWEVYTGKLLLTYGDHITELYDVAWSPDGKLIASAGYEVRVWVAPD